MQHRIVNQGSGNCDGTPDSYIVPKAFAQISLAKQDSLSSKEDGEIEYLLKENGIFMTDSSHYDSTLGAGCIREGSVSYWGGTSGLLLCPLLPEEGFGFPEAGVTGALPDLGTGNETQVLWTEQALSHSLLAQGCACSHSALDCQCD